MVTNVHQTTVSECDRQHVPTGVTSTQLARDLGVHVRTVQRWYRERKISPEYVTPGGHPRYSTEDVRRQLREQGEPTDS